MSNSLVLLISFLMPTAALALLLAKKRVPEKSRKVVGLGLIALFAIDLFAAYKLLSLPKPETARSIPAAVEPTPSEEGKNFALTKACQKMQREQLAERGISEEHADAASLPVCVCVSDTLKAAPEFKILEEKAAAGQEFLSILSDHKNLLITAMNLCADQISSRAKTK